MRILKYRPSKLALTAFRNRMELVKAGLNRRDFLKMGLLTGAGYLIAKHGLSSRVFAQGGDGSADPAPPPSPPTTAFAEPMPIMPIKQPVASLSPAPQAAPNSAAGEARTRSHQAFTQFPPQKLYTRVAQAAQISVSKDLPLQPLWTFDGNFPGPTYIAKYGEPILVRTSNILPSNNGGFGKNETTVHTHNGHTPSESDGFPCDFFGTTFNGLAAFYDQHYPNVLAGFSSTNQPNGDINESLSTLWYHDHRVDFTAQNVYKGMAGFYLLFNQFDTGDETTGFRLPSGEFDVPMMFNDKIFDSATGLLAFDLMNTDGILGDKFLVNGIIQPFFQVRPRRYRLRWLNGGPSRFYQLFLTDPNNLSANNAFFQIANDGNLMPKPVQVTSVRLGVAERCDVIIDFSKYAGKSIFIENRLQQTDGRKPGSVLAAGQGNNMVRIDVNLPSVADNSQDPATITKFYSLPSTTATPRVTRTFNFVRSNGQWQINGQVMDCNTTRFTVQKNSVEKWVLVNSSGGWQHPIHIHFEEHQILSRNGVATASNSVEKSRKDVTRLQFNETVELFFRFRDFKGFYPLHCHNLVHEDDAMMLKWAIDDTGDTNSQP
jgi:FtsP/CotA-like multicopper oxidase with cupredoxin domain